MYEQQNYESMIFRSTRKKIFRATWALPSRLARLSRMVSLLTEDALLTMPPLPLEYEGHEAIAGFLSYRESARGTSLRVIPTWANTHPAFGCYTPDAEAGIASAAGQPGVAARVVGRRLYRSIAVSSQILRHGSL